MTSAEWLTCTNPQKMLDLLGCICSPYWRAMQHNINTRRLRGLRLKKVSARKLHLFACACCRRIWDQIRDARSRRAVEVLELYADGRATEDELVWVARDAWEAWRERQDDAHGAVMGALHTPSGASDEDPDSEPLEGIDAVLADTSAALQASWVPAGSLLEMDEKAWNAALNVEGAAQCALLRDIFANPFRPGCRILTAWLTWNDAVVIRLAEAIYEEHAWDRLPILADALEEAGCSHAVLLGHLRGPGPHTPGCWAVDRLLGRE